MALEPLEVVCVKEEPRDWDGAGRACAGDVQPDERVQIKVEVDFVKKEGVKEEPEWEDGRSSASEAGNELGSEAQAFCITPPAVSNRPSASSARPTKQRRTAKKYHPRGTTHTCEVCEKTCNRFSKYKLHKRTHTREKPYKCEICKKQFTRLDSVKLHMRTHTGEHSYCCEICKKKFTGMARFNVHKRIHTGEKPYSCDMCEKKFAQLGHLQAHTRVHTGEKQYACSVCGKEFGQAGNLKTHMLTHSKEKPYLCEICKKEFSRLHYLKKHHKLLHTGELLYSYGGRKS